MILLLFGIAILPVIIGILLDWRLRTAPIITLAMMFLGFNIGIVTIYRRIAVIYMQISPPDQVAAKATGETSLASHAVQSGTREGQLKHLGGDQ